MGHGEERDYRHYVPILKGRLGELTALKELDDTQANRLTPLIEVVPSTVEYTDEGEPVSGSVHSDVSRFIERVSRRWPSSRALIVDASLLPAGSSTLSPTVDLVHQFARHDRQVIPTLRPSFPDRDIRAIGESLKDWKFERVCLRLAGEDLDDTDSPIPESIERVLVLLDMQPSDINLVLDLGSIADERSVSFASRIARLVLGEIPHEKEWRNLSLASGAFPTDLSGVQPGVLTDLPRLDANLWLQVRKRARGRIPSFSDYGISHPIHTAGVAFAPAPQLRYTIESNWLVMKGRRRERRGLSQFFDICQRVASHEEFTAGLSWGDLMIAKAAHAADHPDPATNTGNAMTWRAIGTSHHLALVTSRLANSDGP